MTVQSVSYPLAFDATGVPKHLSVRPPQGFGTILGLTFANNTPFIAIVKGANDSYSNQESVMPYVVQRWSYSNTTGALEVDWNTSGLSTPGSMASVVVNWSDDPQNDLPGAYPLLTNAGLLAGLQGQGIVGASGGLSNLTATTVVGGIGTFPALAGGSPNLSIWNVLIIGTVTQPTSGGAYLATSIGVIDAISVPDLASNRLAGIIIPNNGTMAFDNLTNQTVEMFLLVSPHS